MFSNVSFGRLQAKAAADFEKTHNSIPAQYSDQDTVLYHRQLVHIAPGHQGQHFIQALLRLNYVQAIQWHHSMAHGNLSPLLAWGVTDIAERDQAGQLIGLHYQGRTQTVWQEVFIDELL